MRGKWEPLIEEALREGRDFTPDEHTALMYSYSTCLVGESLVEAGLSCLGSLPVEARHELLSLGILGNDGPGYARPSPAHLRRLKEIRACITKHTGRDPWSEQQEVPKVESAVKNEERRRELVPA